MTARVLHLYLKPAHGAPLAPAARLVLDRGIGIAGDVHAGPGHPRQVLLTRSEEVAALGLAPGDLRENVCIEGLAAADFAPGREFAFAGGAAVRLVFRCEPCSQLAPLVARPAALTGRRGMLAVVVRGGVVAAGDTVRVSGTGPSLPDRAAERAAWLIARIPAGRVLDYRGLLALAGLRPAYFRALPGYVSAALKAGLPAWRMVDTQRRPPARLGAWRDMLLAEGIRLDAEGRADQAQLWRPAIGPLLGLGG